MDENYYPFLPQGYLDLKTGRLQMGDLTRPESLVVWSSLGDVATICRTIEQVVEAVQNAGNGQVHVESEEGYPTQNVPALELLHFLRKGSEILCVVYLSDGKTRFVGAVEACYHMPRALDEIFALEGFVMCGALKSEDTIDSRFAIARLSPGLPFMTDEEMFGDGMVDPKDLFDF